MSLRNLVSSCICVAAITLLITGSASAEIDTLERAMQSAHPLIKQVVKNAKKYELQVSFSSKSLSAQSTEPRHTPESYGLNAARYFYPASTVKLPMALMAAEFISQHPSLELTTPYTVGEDKSSYTIAEDITLIFAVSDDQAYNRLYELFGRDALNKRMNELGYSKFRIAHRLAVEEADAMARRPVVFDSLNGFLTFRGSDSKIVSLQLEGLTKGRAYIKQGALVRKPFDFSFKNYFPLEEQHRLLNELFTMPAMGFKLSDKERAFLLQAMAATPNDAGKSGKEFYDSYVKFFMVGDTKQAIPEHIKIYNKVGYAYGTLTDNAYVVDEKYGVEFFLSASLLVNKNRTFNDDAYEYDSLGIPFLAQLGREVYAIELAKIHSQQK